MAEDLVQVNFRMPSRLKERLESAALENSRSLTSEVVFRLEASLDNRRVLDERLEQLSCQIQMLSEEVNALQKKPRR